MGVWLIRDDDGVVAPFPQATPPWPESADLLAEIALDVSHKAGQGLLLVNDS